MTKNRNYPRITAAFETVTPATAEKWLSNMVPNRKVKDGTVVSYATDMANGAWLLSPQGIAFDDGGRLFDGQHRLRAVIRSGASVPLLVLRGFPSRQDDMGTMDVVDCGVIRSLPDRLKLMGTYTGSPNLTCAVARQIAQHVMGRNRRVVRRPSLAVVLEVIGIWKDEIRAVCGVLDRPAFTQARNAEVVAAMTLAAAVFPKKAAAAASRLASGAGLDHGSPILELRNALISGRHGDERGARLALTLSALLCEWTGLEGRRIGTAENLTAATAYFRDHQAERFAQVERLFPAEPAAL